MASFPQASPPTPCSHLYPPPYALHALPISFVSILPPAKYWVRSTDRSAPRYAAFIGKRFTILNVWIKCLYQPLFGWCQMPDEWSKTGIWGWTKGFICCSFICTYLSQLTLILLTRRIGWAPKNGSKWQMKFNSAFKELNTYSNTVSNYTSTQKSSFQLFNVPLINSQCDNYNHTANLKGR